MPRRGGVADHHLADVFHADGNAVVAADDDFADVIGGFDQAQAANVVELAALGVEAAAGVGVVGLQRVDDLDDGEVKVVEPRGIEQHLIFHGRPAETRIVGNARDAAIGALDDPVFVGVQLHAGSGRGSR